MNKESIELNNSDNDADRVEEIPPHKTMTFEASKIKPVAANGVGIDASNVKITWKSKSIVKVRNNNDSPVFIRIFE
jgi:hypothetical protein